MKQDTPSSTESSGLSRREALARTAGLVIIAGVSGATGAEAHDRHRNAVGQNGA